MSGESRRVGSVLFCLFLDRAGGRIIDVDSSSEGPSPKGRAVRLTLTH